MSTAPIKSRVVTVVAALLASAWTASLVASRERERPEEPPPVAHAPGSPDQPLPRVDRHGDPLPQGALLRLGTVRFRHPDSTSALALSPDGRTVATLGSGTLRVWDAATGKQLHRFPDAPMN